MHRPTADEDALRLHRRLNRTDAGYPADRSVKDLFERCAAARPDAVAVVQGERTLTYRELNRRANALAAVLLDAGLGPGDVAAVCVDRSPELIVALLAVVKCGAGYLPVDGDWPDARLTVLFEQAGCRLLITDRAPALRQRFPDRRTVPVGDVPDHDGADPLNHLGGAGHGHRVGLRHAVARALVDHDPADRQRIVRVVDCGDEVRRV